MPSADQQSTIWAVRRQTKALAVSATVGLALASVGVWSSPAPSNAGDVPVEVPRVGTALEGESPQTPQAGLPGVRAGAGSRTAHSAQPGQQPAAAEPTAPATRVASTSLRGKGTEPHVAGSDDQQRTQELQRQLSEVRRKAQAQGPSLALARQVSLLTSEMQGLYEVVGSSEAHSFSQEARADDVLQQLDASRAQALKAWQRHGAAEASLTALRNEVGASQQRTASAQAALARATAQTRAAQAAVKDLQRQLADARATPPSATRPYLSRRQLLRMADMFGLYTAHSPLDAREFSAVEQAVDRDADVTGFFQNWTNEFRPEVIRTAWAQQHIPMLTWESRSPGRSDVPAVDDPAYSLPRILAGEHDAYLHRYAKGIADLGMPLALRFDHEMNGNWYPWSEGSSTRPLNGNRPGDFARMWRHVHAIFEAEGANEHVVWVWSPSRVDTLGSLLPMSDYWPGDEYVDWVGMSGYLRPNYTVPTFAHTFGATLQQLRALTDKPVYLTEIGATDVRGLKSAWITDLFTALARPENDDIIGFSWFNLLVSTTTAPNDWRITTSPDSRTAFADGIARLGYGRDR